VLADLASRFGAATVHRLAPLEEAEQAEALARRARHRGLELPKETLTFLTRRAPRDFSALCRLLDELDLESLAAQRRLTVPFVRDWLQRSGG
jgi:DnaA-homolog protein